MAFKWAKFRNESNQTAEDALNTYITKNKIKDEHIKNLQAIPSQKDGNDQTYLSLVHEVPYGIEIQ